LILYLKWYVSAESDEYVKLIMSKEFQWFKNLWRRADKTEKTKNCKFFLKKLESQKLLHVLDNKNNYKIWINIKIILKELLQIMINLKATNNYILHETVQWFELISQWWRNSMYVYITNISSIIVQNYIHMKMIIKNVL